MIWRFFKNLSRNLGVFFIILGLTLVVTRVYFQADFPYTHDGENHLARFANYKIALREGQFPPRFAPNLMNRYGYPVFNYNYPLANILSVPFSLLDFNYELTFKLIASTFVAFGVWGVWRWLKSYKLKFGARFLGMTLFALSPYLTNLIFYRGNIGELMAISLFPWLLYLIEVCRKRPLQLIEVLVLLAFLLAHNITVMFGLPLVLIYALLRGGLAKKMWRHIAQSWLWAIAAGLWFWLPAVVEKNLVNIGQANLVTGFGQHFPQLKQLLLSPLNFGFSQAGPVDSLSFSLGLGLVGVLMVAMIVLASFLRRWLSGQAEIGQAEVGNAKIGHVKWWLLSLGSVLLLIIFQLEVSREFWLRLPLVAYIQFPWRLSLFMASFGALLGALTWQKIGSKSKLLITFLIFIQLVAQLKAEPADFFHKTNLDYDAFTQTTTTQNENRARTFTYQEIADWQPTAEILKGQGAITVKRWTGSKHSYELEVTEISTIVEPTMSFAGWETVVQASDGQKTQVEHIDDEEIRGRLAYKLEPGSYQVWSRFTQKTWSRIVGNVVSAAAILGWLYLFLKKRFGQKASFYLNLTLGLLLLAFSAGALVKYQPVFPYADVWLATSNLPRWLYSWANFDGVHYLTIAKNGYFGTGLIQAFFPVWPIILRFGARLGLETITAGLVFNFIFGWLLFKKWFKLLKFEFSRKVAWWGTVALFLFPTAFFFQALYSETLFLWLVVSSFYAARKKRWWRAGLWAAIAAATRIVGIMLLPALLIELGEEIGWSELKLNLKQHWKKLVAVSLSAVGLIAYMFYLWQQFGDPLYFFHVQAEFGSGRTEGLVLYPRVIWRYLKILTTTQVKNWRYFIYVQEFLAGVVGLAVIVLSWFKVRKSYLVFSFLAFLLPTLTGTFSSLPRYILVCPALFVVLGQWLADKKWFRYLWLPISILLLAINTMLFIQGWWVA